MLRFSSVRARLREIEEGRGARDLVLTFPDEATRRLQLRRNERLKILLASFDIARGSVAATSRAAEIARMIGRARDITPRSRLCELIASNVRQEECPDGESQTESSI